jgi:hypothetical protein
VQPPAGAPTPLLLDLVEWVAAEPRLYDELMEAWRTSCPRHTVWEDAVDRALIRRRRDRQGRTLVAATPRGLEFLRDHGRGAAPAPRSTRGESGDPR